MRLIEALEAGRDDAREGRRYAWHEYAPGKYLTVSDDEIVEGGYLVVWSTDTWQYRDHTVVDSLADLERYYTAAFHADNWQPGRH